MVNVKETRINEQITAKTVRLIGKEGEQIGIVSLQEAREAAEEADLDLVEISPTANPPVCKIIDYGKFKYEQAKKQDEARKKQKQIHIKEIKFRPNTDVGDYQVKLRNIRRFFEEGNKVKVTLRFRGRELVHQKLGAELLERVKEDTQEISIVEQMPKMEGRQMIMMLAPLKKK
ncbi:MAG: translation initiation factor IF-3 [Haemophilus parainfluenzae]|nr:MAG: translation initiation factor IF-3 [Haemophilus parainfluenzae]